MLFISRCLTTIVCLLWLVASADAGVRISLSGELPAGQHVMVKTDLVSSGRYGNRHQPLATGFLQAGEQIILPAPLAAPKSRRYDQVIARGLHPAYAQTESRSQAAPTLRRTVTLPPLQPLAWRSLLTSATHGNGISAAAIDDHLRQILEQFLPAFDRAGAAEDLRQYLPLLRELAAYGQSAKTGQHHQTPAESKNAPAQDQLDLGSRLQKIEAWLALTQQRRRPMHDWLENYQRPRYVFNNIMQEADRKKVMAMLQQSDQPSHFRSHSWLNQQTGVKFTFSLDTRSKTASGPGYRTSLHTDLNPRLGLQGQRAYRRKCTPLFVREPATGWQIQ